jgi:hypothetical protein
LGFLDLVNFMDATDTQVQLWDCEPNDAQHGYDYNQIWYEQYNGDGTWTFKVSGYVRFCLDSEGALSAGSPVVVWSCNGGNNQKLAVSMPAVLAQRYSCRLAEASAIVREVSAAEGSTCVDFWNMPELLDAHCYSVDGTHPNARGYLRVAQMLAAAVARQTGIEVAESALYLESERDPAPTPRPSWATPLWAYLEHVQGTRLACFWPAPNRGRPRSQVSAFCLRLAVPGLRFGALGREVEA